MAYSVSSSTVQQNRARGQQSPLGFRPTGKSSAANKEIAGEGGAGLKGKAKEKQAPLRERSSNVVQDDMDEDEDDEDDELSMLRQKAPSPPKRKPAARRAQQRRAQVMAIERLQGKRSDLRPRSMWAPKVPCTKRSHFDLELSGDEDESPPPAKKAATGAARKPAAKKKVTSALEEDKDDDEDMHEIEVKEEVLSPGRENKKAKNHVVWLDDSEDEFLPSPKIAGPAKAKSAPKEAVVESDEDEESNAEPEHANEMETENEEFVVLYDSFEEADPAPEKEAAAVPARPAEEVSREKEVVGLGDMGGEVIAALEKRPVAGKDKRAGLLTYSPANFHALDRMGLMRKRQSNLASSSSAAPAAAVEKRRPSIRRSRVARTSSGSSASGQTRIEHAPRTTTYGVQWGVGSSSKAAAPGPSGAPAAAAAATGSVRPYSQAFAKLRAVFEPEGASGSSTSARKAPSSKAWKR
ncbi:hypothetical protein JCM9279_006963 [Rhodotorula babjevae]